VKRVRITIETLGINRQRLQLLLKENGLHGVLTEEDFPKVQVYAIRSEDVQKIITALKELQRIEEEHDKDRM
jgi:hypothetical protein